jgi:uncharacterized membrane protein
MYRWLRLSSFVIALWTCTVAAEAADYNFSILNVDFPSFRDDLFGCVASGLNDRGAVVGGCNDRSRNSNFRAFIFDGRKFSEFKLSSTKSFEKRSANGPILANLIIERRSVYQSAAFHGGTRQAELSVRPNDIRFRNLPNAQDVNNSGAVTGWFFDGLRLQGFLKRQGADRTIFVPNSLLTEALGINDLEQIVGDFRDAAGFFRSFIYDRGSFRSIDVPFVPNADSGAFGINNSGKVVGCYSICSRGYLFDIRSGQFTASDVPGAIVTQPSDINDNGHIVGVFFDGQVLRSFFFDGTGFHTIDVPGAFSTNVTGINNAGQIVGNFIVENSQGEFDSFAFVGAPR